jgi:hypothetical protein
MHSLVSHGIVPISHQISETEKSGHPEAHAAIKSFHATLERHESVLKTRLEGLGGNASAPIQDVASAVAGFVAGVYNQVRSEAVSKSLRDDYTFLSHCSIAWLMLMTTARSLGDTETEELSEAGYRDCARLIMDIDRLMPKVVVQELKQDQLPAQDASTWAVGIVQGAWDWA